MAPLGDVERAGLSRENRLPFLVETMMSRKRRLEGGAQDNEQAANFGSLPKFKKHWQDQDIGTVTPVALQTSTGQQQGQFSPGFQVGGSTQGFAPTPAGQQQQQQYEQQRMRLKRGRDDLDPVPVSAQDKRFKLSPLGGQSLSSSPVAGTPTQFGGSPGQFGGSPTQFGGSPIHNIGAVKEPTRRNMVEEPDASALAIVPYEWPPGTRPSHETSSCTDLVQYSLNDHARQPKLLGDWEPALHGPFPSNHSRSLVVYSPPSVFGAADNQTTEEEKEKSAQRMPTPSPFRARWPDKPKPIESVANPLCEITLLDNDEDVVMDS